MRLRSGASERDPEARADVVSERDGAQETRSADAELLAYRESGRDDGAARMPSRWPRIVGLVRMREHAVDEGSLDRSAYQVRRHDGCHLRTAIGFREANCRPPRNELGSGDHGRERVERVTLGSLGSEFRQRPVLGSTHVRTERRSDSAERLSGGWFLY